VKDFVLIFFMMVVTFGVRYPVLALVGRFELPPLVQRALKFVPVAVLSAVSAPIVLIRQDQWDVSVNNPFLVASLVAIVVAWKSRNLLLTIVIGLLIFAAMKIL